MKEELIGKVTHYFRRIGVAVLSLEKSLWKGDTIHIVGHTTSLEQRVDSMELNHQRIEYAMPGDEVAVKVTGKVRPGDEVYLECAEEKQPELDALAV